MNGVSLFSSAGIAETYFKKNGIDIVVASEIKKNRCELYSYHNKDCNMISGDITNPDVFNMVKKETLKNNCKFLIATPPCQGMSTLGKKEYQIDRRNYLIFSALDLIDSCNFDYILIENVPKFLKLYFPYKRSFRTLLDIVTDKYSGNYNIESFELNAKDYGVPQSRPRGFIKIWKKNLLWNNPKPKKTISLREAIGHLPSLESGQKSNIKWHYSKIHNQRDIQAMKHTPEGKSAFLNKVYYPKKANGEKMKGFHNTFKRMKWDEPCPARTIQSGNMGGHNNVHPGRKLPNGTYSDARVLTIRELFIVSSLPEDWTLPADISDSFIRAVIGEAIPPKFCEAIIKGIKKMIQLERSMIHKWIIDKNVNSKEIITEFTALLSNAQSGFNFDELVSQTITQGRANNGSTITIGVRLLQSCFYMFGYSTNLEDGRKIFMPSPMTLNILSSLSPEQEANNFLVNLFSMQYPHPFDWTPQCFKIYFGRLIIKLLLEKRIDNKLYIDECIWFLPFIETISNDKYEELVASILEYRTYNYQRKKDLFESVENYHNLFANVTHELNYYFFRLFADFNVFNLVGDPLHNEGKLFKFLHSSTENSNTYRNDAYKSRKNHSGYIELTNVVQESARKLIDSFSPFELPSHIDGIEIFSKENWITNIYQIEPLKYLACINTKIDKKSEIMSIVNEMVNASKYGSRDGKEFENALKPFVELFKEAINIEILSGAGNTDLLCVMEEQSTYGMYNMNLEAKTRSSALEGVQTTRINKHLSKHGSKFCIVVAPKFAKGVHDDILGNKIVTIRSEELGNYCYKECTSSGSGLADFSSILNIINNNLGTDITHKVRSLTESRYGLAVR